MPYIKPEDRELVKEELKHICQKIDDVYYFKTPMNLKAGFVNYIISKIVYHCILREKVSYETLNKYIGVLDCVSSELKRRLLHPLEDEKIKINGDIYK